MKSELNVKRIFFISKDEAKKMRETSGDGYIDHLSPHFELEDGTIKWGKVGYPAGGERWFAELGVHSNE